MGPPSWPLAVLVAVSLTSIVLAWVGPIRFGLAVPTAGYALGAIGAVVLLTLYRALRDRRRGRLFRPSPLKDRLAYALAILGLLAGLFCAFQLATELAK